MVLKPLKIKPPWYVLLDYFTKGIIQIFICCALTKAIPHSGGYFWPRPFQTCSPEICTGPFTKIWHHVYQVSLIRPRKAWYYKFLIFCAHCWTLLINHECSLGIHVHYTVKFWDACLKNTYLILGGIFGPGHFRPVALRSVQALSLKFGVMYIRYP